MKTYYQDLLLLVLEILAQDYQSLRAPDIQVHSVLYGHFAIFQLP